MADPFVILAEKYLASGDTLRQIVRHALVARALEAHLPDPPARTSWTSAAVRGNKPCR